jgi:lipopolysaccharide/colanic/teichoic acid biosynthesis glycosyltransferase
VKRLFDLIVIALSAPLWAPLMGLTAVLVRAKLGGPILFRQVRPGLGGQPFQLLKFRTMAEARDAQGNYLPNEQRLTGFGSWLRSTSLDELPELINVARGDMSLVGPRPLLMQYLARYTPEQARRHKVRPGITGWAQVNGRNTISWEEKFKLDVWYVDHQSLWLDIRILWMTAWGVLRRHGINQAGLIGSQEFMGSSPSALGTEQGRLSSTGSAARAN